MVRWVLHGLYFEYYGESRSVDNVAQELYKAGKIKDLCEDADFFTRLTKLEAQYPNASVLVHKQGVLPAEIADLWSSPQLMSAACQFLGGGPSESGSTCQALYWCWGYWRHGCLFCGYPDTLRLVRTDGYTILRPAMTSGFGGINQMA